MPVMSPQAAAAAAGAKRKRSGEQKFYAVRIGRRPGVYQEYPDCMAQIKGFKGATFKSFPTLTDAEKFVAGQDPLRPGDQPRPTKFYAVKSGRVPGIYTDWAQASKQITGVKQPKHRCFSTRAEAEQFLNGDGDGNSKNSAAMDELEAQYAPSSKKQKKGGAAAGNAPKAGTFVPTHTIFDGYEPGTILPPNAHDGFDTNIIFNPQTGIVFKNPSQRAATKLQATGMARGQPLRVYTDGSSLRNGQKGSMAGVGVYFGPRDHRNISEPLPGGRQTNQRAELAAMVRALDTAPKDRDVVIVSDSEYSIKCATTWVDGWRQNGWRTTTGKAVENRDLVESVTARVEERTALGSQTRFEWVKGHANHPGNVEADKLAVNGARMAQAGPRVSGYF